MKNRKFVLSLVSLSLLTGSFLACFWLPALVGVYPTLVGGILGVLAAYSGANVIQDLSARKHGPAPDDGYQPPP